MQVGAADVADQERVAAEDEPRLVGAATTIGDRVGVVGGRMAGCGDRRDERVAELNDVAVGERDMLEPDAGAGGQGGGRAAALDERRQTGDMVCLPLLL